MNTESVRHVLQLIFAYGVFPLTTVGVFAYLVGAIARVIRDSSAPRSLTGAALPVAILAFVVFMDADPNASLAEALAAIPFWARFAIGFTVALAVSILGDILLGADSDTGAAVYCLFMSMTGCFILYCLVSGILSAVHVMLLGLIIGGGLYVILRGFPGRRRPA